MKNYLVLHYHHLEGLNLQERSGSQSLKSKMMNHLRYYISFFLLLFAGLAFSQVKIKGDLRLGDTTQVHILHTTKGDRLQGRVIGYDTEKLSFLFKDDIPLTFPLAEVSLIEVNPGQPTAGEEPDSIARISFIYLISLANGDKTSGQVTRSDSRSLRLSPGQYYYWENIDSVELVSQPISRHSGRSKIIHVLKTKRGDQFYGQLLSYGNGIVYFEMENGAPLKFSLKEIRQIKMEERANAPTSKLRNEEVEYWSANKLFFSPSAFLPQKKKSQYQNLMLFYNSIDYGASEHISIGVSLVPFIAGTIGALKAKAGLDISPYLHAGIGGQLFGAYTIDEETMGAAVGYAALTVGTPENYLSFSFGKGAATNSQPLTNFNLGGSVRAANQWRFFGEYMLFQVKEEEVWDSPDRLAVGLLGASWFNARHRIDFGLSLFQENDYSYFVPVFGYVHQF